MKLAWLIGSRPRATLIRAAVLVAGAVVIFGYVLRPVRLTGISMLPTYQSGSINFANRLAFVWRQPARNDVIAIRMAGPGVLYIKRVIGLPRERLEIVAGVVLVNGQPLAEPTVRDKAPWNVPPLTLADDEFFVIGDNRAMPMENHEFGRVKRDRIVGRILF